VEISGNLASRAYANSRSIIEPTALDPKANEESSPDFAAMAKELVATLQTGEATAKQGLVGQADAHSVVEALAATELAVETAITIRDKVVEAYQEILRMPV